MQSTEPSLDEGTTKPFQKPTYSAVEEVTFIFLNTMMEYVVKSWTTLSVDVIEEAAHEDESEVSDSGKNEQSVPVEPAKKEPPKKTPQKVTAIKEEINEHVAEEEGSVAFVEWRLQKPDETAIVELLNGDIFEGHIRHLMMDGPGVYKWADGSSYTGPFVNNTATGIGKIKWPDLSWYEGDILEGYRNGQGTYCIGYTTLAYFGFWYAGMKHGKGYLNYLKDDFYDGEWQADVREGVGRRLYSDGSFYYGEWHKGLRHGVGNMCWANNDFYRGDWSEGYMHGYGEYTWNGFFNKYFVYPVENTYHGYWKKGVRHGIGTLNFGVFSGAKFEGYFYEGQKHGSGAVLCGNGVIIRQDPLFLYDKPVHETTDHYYPKPIDHTVMITYVPKALRNEGVHRNRRASFPQRSKPAEKVVETPQPYEQEIEYFQNKPIEIAVHAPSHTIDVTYEVSKVCEKYAMNKELVDNVLVIFGKDYKSSDTLTAITQHKQKAAGNAEAKVKQKSGDISEDPSMQRRDTKLSFSDPSQEIYEETCVRHCLLTHLPRLWEIYRQYGNICADTNKSHRVLLSRMFMWQCFRDCGLYNKNLSLVKIDRILADNPASYVEFVHYPFEKIYFWQFLHCLLGIAWELYQSDGVESENIRGILAGTLTKLLFEDIYPHVGKHIAAKALFEYRDVAPFEAMYCFYRGIGEPITARQFLIEACPIFYGSPRHARTVPTVKKHPVYVYNGKNTITVGAHMTYLSDQIPTIPTRNSADCHSDTESVINDEFNYNLFSLRGIGVVEILNNLAKVCPPIKADHDLVVNMEYELTFLEFYETILKCSEQQFEKLRMQDFEMKMSQWPEEESPYMKKMKESQANVVTKKQPPAPAKKGK